MMCGYRLDQLASALWRLDVPADAPPLEQQGPSRRVYSVHAAELMPLVSQWCAESAADAFIEAAEALEGFGFGPDSLLGVTAANLRARAAALTASDEPTP